MCLPGLHTSVIVSCRIHLCFLSSHHSFFPLSCVQTYTHFVNVAPPHLPSIVIILPSILNTDESLPSPFSCLSFVPPSLPPFLLLGSQPRCYRLPSPSLGAPLWVLGSAASASPAVCSLALPLLCSPSQTQYSLPFGLRGGEGKHFKLQIQPGKQGYRLPCSSTDCKSECSLKSH